MTYAVTRELMQTTLRTLAVTLGVLALGRPVAAQEAVRTVPPVSVASDHWVYPLLDRMAADGLLDGVWTPGRRPVGGGVIAAALDTAAARAAEGSHWTGTVEAARAWLLDELGMDEGERLRAFPAAGVRLASGPLTDPTAAILGADIRYQPWGSAALWGEPRLQLGDGGIDLPVPRLGAAWRAGPLRLSASYDAHRLGPGASGGIVIHDAVRFPWLEAALDRPVVLPWVLKYLGPFQISGSVTGIDADSLGPSVAFFKGEFRLQPHPRVTLGLFRSILVATELNGQSPGLDDIFLIVTGSRSSPTFVNFDDQKASMSGSVRLDPFGFTLVPYFVWAWEDTWEIDEDPGTILGLWAPLIPVGDTPLGVRYEYTAFGDPAQIIWPWGDGIWQHRRWYRHDNIRIRYRDGDGEFMGHPLGGYGTEHRLELEVPAPAYGILIRGVLFARERVAGTTVNPHFDPPRTQEYFNLLYDQVPGRSWGGSVRGLYFGGPLQLDASLTLEIGEEGWDRFEGSVGAVWLLP